MKTLTSLYYHLPAPAKRVLWFILSVATLLTFLTISLIDAFLAAPNLLYRVANAIPAVLALVAYVSAYAILARRITVGAWLFFITTLAVMLTVPFIAEGYALPGAILTIIVTILVPLQVFKKHEITLSNVAGLTVGGLMILTDQFYTGPRVPVAAADVQNAQFLAIGLTVLLIASVTLLYRIFNLNTKLLVLTLGASLLSVISVAGFANLFTQRLLEDKTNELLMRSATHSAELIDAFIDFNRDLIRTQANLPILRRYLQADETERLRLRPELRQTMRDMLNRDSTNIGSYALLDEQGITVWDTYTQDIGVDKSDRDYFWVVMTTGNPFLSAVRFSPTSPDHGFYISAPVKDPTSGKILGVLRVRFRSSILREIILGSTRFSGEQSYGILLDEYNIILVDAAHPDYFGRTPGTLEPATIALLKSNGRLLRGTPDENISLKMPIFINALRNFTINPYFASNDPAFQTAVRGAIARPKSQPWKVVFVQAATVAQKTITDLARTITVIALATSFILGVATLLISRTITVPLSQLTQTAEQLSTGNLHARASIRSQDELGTLAETLNSMSSQLEETLSGLEQTIAQRTADLEQRSQELEQRTEDLEAATRRSERRAAQLLAVSSVANAIANIQNLDDLLPRIAEVISQQFGFYHVGIFLNDVSNTYTVLRATNSEGGQRMLAHSHRLKIGEVGIVGAVAGSGRPRIALDTGDDAVFFNNPDLPETRSEMALPLRSGAHVIGVLDVQSTEPNAFSDEDIEIITILADQVSTAIRNAQLFQASQLSAQETQLLLQTYARDQWRRVARAQRTGGYRFDGTTIIPVQKTPETEGVVSIPVVVRGQPIGKLGIRPPQGRNLSQDELDIVKSITERLAIAAENARLLQESQERASKEQTIGEISAKIGASINLRSILQTAVEELGQVLPGSEVTIKLETKK